MCSQDVEVLREVRWQMLRKAHEKMRCEMWRQMRSEVRTQMRGQVRTQELNVVAARRFALPLAGAGGSARSRLLEAYAALAARGEHLFASLLQGGAPKQWAHYPDDDAIDRASGYQWFYHSHSPEDRAVGLEHGHIHLFAKRPLWGRRMRSRSEQEFATLCGNPVTEANTRHLLAIGFNAKGLPISLFTVNSWVTGDLMLSANLTMALLSSMNLKTGHPEVDAVVESTVRMCLPELHRLMLSRDRALAASRSPGKLSDDSLELLSEIAVDLDTKLMEQT